MKKSVLNIAVIALFSFWTSCASEANHTKPFNNPDPTTTGIQIAASGTPVFSSEEVNQGLADYKRLMDEYTLAIQKKDAVKIQELSAAYQLWSRSAASWATKLRPDEAQQYSDYMQVLSKEWAIAAQHAGDH
jgi:hypothetical protein